ncbi:MAG: response regulator [Patescibacteria group bacterium]
MELRATQKKSVLLIEDEQIIRELYATALVNEGFDILMAENGEQGLAFARSRHPDIILLDIDLPVMDGHETMKLLRADAWGKTVPVIFLTNHSETEHVAHASLEQPAGYVVKANTSIKDLVAMVQTAAGR